MKISQQQPAAKLCREVPMLHRHDSAGHRHHLQQALQMPSVSPEQSPVARICVYCQLDTEYY